MEGNEFRNPYAVATPSLDLTQPTSYERAPTKAGRLARLLAYFGDVGAFLLTMLPAGLAAVLHDRGSSVDAVGSILLLLSAVAILGLVVYNLVLLHREGQTVGKRWIGIRIVRNDGSRASLGRIFLLRSFVPGLIGAIPYLGTVFGLANILWIFGEEKRCLHDYMADTIVVIA